MVLGRNTERKYGDATLIGNGKIANSDDIHPNKDIGSRQLIFGDTDIGERNTIRTCDVNQIHFTVGYGIHAVNLGHAYWLKAARIYDLLSYHRGRGSRVPYCGERKRGGRRAPTARMERLGDGAPSG